jgi:hypothetical protein
MLLVMALLLGVGCDPRSPVARREAANAGTPFLVAAFPADGERDVRRDEPLVVEFSAPVDPRSLRPGSIRILRRRGNVEVPITLTVRGTRVTIHPPDPFGLDGRSGYWLIIEGFPSLSAVADLSGRPLSRRYRGRFWTSRFYRPGLDPPSVTSVEARQEPGGRYSVRLRFSKPMEASSLTARGNLEVFSEGGPVDGDLSHDRRAEVFRFVPRGGERPRALRVVLSRAVRDLLGNPLALPEPPEFFVPLPALETADIGGEVSEDFTTCDQLDPAGTTALWNSGRAPGVLLGEPGSLDFLPGPETGRPVVPVSIGAERTNVRVLYRASELGPAREITGLLLESLGPLMLSEHEDLTIRVTRTLRQRLDERGQDLAPALVVFEARPWHVTAGERGTMLIPLLPTITHDGAAGLLFEISIGPGTHSNLLRAFDGDPRRAEIRQGAGSLSVHLALGLRGFSLEPLATSRFYDSGEDAPRWLDPVAEPSGMPAGVVLGLQFQGASRLSKDGLPPEEPGVVSEWTDDVTRLSGFRYLRFRAVFRGVNTGCGDAVLDALRIPFRAVR